MSFKPINHSELFITRMRWLVILGSPLLFYLSGLNMKKLFWIIIIGTAFMNFYVHFFFINRPRNNFLSHFLSFADILFVSALLFLREKSQTDLHQLYYFLILVLGIRYGFKRYFGLVFLIGSVYTLVTLGGTWYYRTSLDSVQLVTQLIYFSAFGILTSFILQREHAQQLEKERLISELQTAYRQLSLYNAKVEQMAIKDPLTELYNYRYFKERMGLELEWAKKNYKPLSLILIDIDNFKKFNDTYGHPAGDKALKKAGEVFKKNVRDRDILVRYGGEEFLVLLPDTGIEEARLCAERIRTSLANTDIIISEEEAPVKITVSAGVASFPHNGMNDIELMKSADKALYLAKKQGRNQVQVYQA